MSLIIWTTRIAVAAVFVAAAVPKILDPAAFADDIANYQSFPRWSWNLLAVIVPMVELVGAASLLTGWKHKAGASLLGILTMAFVVLAASVMVRGIDIECGCFGQLDKAAPVGWSLIVRDLTLMLGIVVAARTTGNEASVRSATGTKPPSRGSFGHDVPPV